MLHLGEGSRDPLAFALGNGRKRRKGLAPSRLAGKYRRLALGKLIQHNADGKNDARVKVMAERFERKIGRPRLEDLYGRNMWR